MRVRDVRTMRVGSKRWDRLVGEKQLSPMGRSLDSMLTDTVAVYRRREECFKVEKSERRKSSLVVEFPLIESQLGLAKETICSEDRQNSTGKPRLGLAWYLVTCGCNISMEVGDRNHQL